MLSFFFFKQKTAYEMRISDWSSDVCSSDLQLPDFEEGRAGIEQPFDAFARQQLAAARVPLARCGIAAQRRLADTRIRSEERRVGKECGSSVDLGGRRIIKKTNKINI